jgi:hypothetical protein
VTLNIGMGVPCEYVVMACDSSLYAAADLDSPEREPVHDVLVPQSKVGLLSRWALVGVGGCVAIGEDFKQLAAERMRPDDDVDAVYAKLHDIVDELRRVDRLGEPYEVAGTHALRGSVERNLTLQVVGFRRDGTVVLIQFGNFVEFDGDHRDTQARFQDYDGEPEHAHFTCGVPNGVPIDDVLGYYVILEPMPLRRAMRHVLAPAPTPHGPSGPRHARLQRDDSRLGRRRPHARRRDADTRRHGRRDQTAHPRVRGRAARVGCRGRR